MRNAPVPSHLWNHLSPTRSCSDFPWPWLCWNSPFFQAALRQFGTVQTGLQSNAAINGTELTWLCIKDAHTALYIFFPKVSESCTSNLLPWYKQQATRSRPRLHLDTFRSLRKPTQPTQYMILYMLSLCCKQFDDNYSNSLKLKLMVVLQVISIPLDVIMFHSVFVYSETLQRKGIKGPVNHSFWGQTLRCSTGTGKCQLWRFSWTFMTGRIRVSKPQYEVPVPRSVSGGLKSLHIINQWIIPFRECQKCSWLSFIWRHGSLVELSTRMSIYWNSD